MATRILNALILVVLGAVLAAVATVAHQSSVKVVGIPVPWGLLLGLIAVGSLLVGVRLVTGARIPTLAASVGVVGMIGLFSLKSQGGSVLIPDDLVGQVWVLAPVAIAAIAVAWPRLTRRRDDATPIEAGVN